MIPQLRGEKRGESAFTTFPSELYLRRYLLKYVLFYYKLIFILLDIQLGHYIYLNSKDLADGLHYLCIPLWNFEGVIKYSLHSGVLCLIG